jgi:hypothetical protein
LRRTEVASSAGLSVRQRKTALRVASVPKREFEAAVESDSPPTIPQLAKVGTKPRPGPERNDQESARFAASTEGQSAIRVLYDAAEKLNPADVAAGASKQERIALIHRAKAISGWLDRLITTLGGLNDRP